MEEVPSACDCIWGSDYAVSCGMQAEAFDRTVHNIGYCIISFQRYVMDYR